VYHPSEMESRRVLYVSYWVPPRNAIGTVRTTHLLKHLRKFGWEITVVTARLPANRHAVHDATCVETRYWELKTIAKRAFGISRKTSADVQALQTVHSVNPGRGVRRILRGAVELLTYRDEHIGWLPFCAQAIRRLIAHGEWDAVLSTAPPMTANVAAALSHGAVPWVADMRDLWAEDDSMERSKLQMLYEDRFERAVLSRAAAVTASSELSAARFQRRYPGTPCTPIFTGFDVDEWKSIDFGSRRKCTFLYAGALYRGKRDPSVFFAALRSVLTEGIAASDELHADFYTTREDWLIELIRRYRLEDVVDVHGFIPRDEVLAAERCADRLVMLSWDGPTAEGVVAGKLFEYFGARRPILGIGGPPVSEVERLLQKTGAGVMCRTAEEAKAEIVAALNEHRTGVPRVISEPAVSGYNGAACAQRFADVLDRVVSTRCESMRAVPALRP
jgi:glycosyltransferase involved in cell wall biosynthesis